MLFMRDTAVFGLLISISLRQVLGAEVGEIRATTEEAENFRTEGLLISEEIPRNDLTIHEYVHFTGRNIKGEGPRHKKRVRFAEPVAESPSEAGPMQQQNLQIKRREAEDLKREIEELKSSSKSWPLLVTAFLVQAAISHVFLGHYFGKQSLSSDQIQMLSTAAGGFVLSWAFFATVLKIRKFFQDRI